MISLRFWIFAVAALAGADAVIAAKPPNIVFITADDLNWDSPGVYGCRIKDITPNIDRLASEGMRFMRAYSTIAVCQPVRATMHTGLYPHRSGCEGFEPIDANVTTLNEVLHRGGYLISMMGKNSHYEPHEKFCIDHEARGGNRSPQLIQAFSKEFLELAKQSGKPFFHQVNCGDPHRPFYDEKQRQRADKAGSDYPVPSRVIGPEEVEVPGFLEDIPDVRKEVAQYFCCVRRLDDCIGVILRALEESGMAKDTVVMFYGGDHGMSFPFAKSNVYEQSNHGALIVRWPGLVRPGSVDERHFVATIDFTPTLIEAAGLPAIPGIDGRSFASILGGGTQEGRDRVFTCYHRTSGEGQYPMRCIRTRTEAYLWNAWSDGTAQYKAENMGGLSWKAMLEAAASDPAIKARADFYLHRAPEEFYDETADPSERRNLVDDPAHRARVEAMRAEMAAFLARAGDPLAGVYAHRDSAEQMNAFRAKLEAAASELKAAKKERRAEKPRQAAKKAAPATKMASPGLLIIDAPAAAERGKPVSLRIRYAIPTELGAQPIQVTLRSGSEKLERKTVSGSGSGAAEVTFSVPSDPGLREVSFAAFLGEDFARSRGHVTTGPVPVK